MIDHAIAATRNDLRRRVWTLRFVSLVAPPIGVFGTCIAIRGAFRSLCGSYESGLHCVSVELLQAVVITALGLLIGIFTHAAYTYCESRIQDFELEMKCAALELRNHLANL